MASLQLEMLSEDEAVVQICRMYWNCDEDGKFISTVAEVAKTYGLKSGDVSKIAYAGCNAYSTTVVCPRCEEPFIFGTRSD